jgi:hypothetical protein
MVCTLVIASLFFDVSIKFRGLWKLIFSDSKLDGEVGNDGETREGDWI